MNKTLQGIKDSGLTVQQTSGVILLAAMGMMAGLMSAEIKELTTWGEIATPSFIGTLLLHFSTVIGAYVAGRLIPEDRTNKNTRRDDDESSEKPQDSPE